MSRVTITGSTRDPKRDWNELDVDEIVDQLTPGEIQSLLDECDPDDPHIPPSLRCNYKCDKTPQAPLDKQKLQDFLNDQALSIPDIQDPVPYVSGTVRGKKWVPPPMPKDNIGFNNLGIDDSIELDIDVEDEMGKALNAASTSDIIDLAGVLGLHSMMNQEQYHSAQSEKWADRPDPTTGWSGITKATPLKQYPQEEPNRTDPNEVITNIKSGEIKTANLNNVPISEEKVLDLCQALRNNETLTELSLANTTLNDYGAANLAAALESNSALSKLNIESNSVSPQCLVKIFEAANVQQVLTEIKASNQMAQFLGNKVEMAITKAVEGNKTLQRVGLHFEFGDCRNRVAVQLQKNLDRVRLRRIQQKLSTGSNPGYEISSPPATKVENGENESKVSGDREKTPATEDEDDCSGAR